jgi:hypothetical protein
VIACGLLLSAALECSADRDQFLDLATALARFSTANKGLKTTVWRAREGSQVVTNV